MVVSVIEFYHTTYVEKKADFSLGGDPTIDLQLYDFNQKKGGRKGPPFCCSQSLIIFFYDGNRGQPNQENLLQEGLVCPVQVLEQQTRLRR